MSDMLLNVKQQIIDWISREHPVAVSNARTLDDQTRLIDEEIIDSLGIFMLVEFLEGRFGIRVDPEEVVVENFETIASITRMVEQKLEGRN